MWLVTDFKDESFWDEISFVFSEDHNQEKSYVIKVLAHDNLSEIVVLDEQKKLLSEGAGLSLLKLLATTLQANLADKWIKIQIWFNTFLKPLKSKFPF